MKCQTNVLVDHNSGYGNSEQLVDFDQYDVDGHAAEYETESDVSRDGYVVLMAFAGCSVVH